MRSIALLIGILVSTSTLTAKPASAIWPFGCIRENCGCTRPIGATEDTATVALELSAIGKGLSGGVSGENTKKYQPPPLPNHLTEPGVMQFYVCVAQRQGLIDSETAELVTRAYLHDPEFRVTCRTYAPNSGGPRDDIGSDSFGFTVWSGIFPVTIIPIGTGPVSLIGEFPTEVTEDSKLTYQKHLQCTPGKTHGSIIDASGNFAIRFESGRLTSKSCVFSFECPGNSDYKDNPKLDFVGTGK